MSRVVELHDGCQRLGILPELGGSLAYWDWRVGDVWQPLLRPWQATPPDAQCIVASFPLLPWSNRIAGGGFEAEGRFHALRPNRVGSPLPIHGNGWMHAWDCAAESAQALTLVVASRHMHDFPFDYDAEQRFSLAGGEMCIHLSITHRGETRMPYGLGQHPFFVFPRGSSLRAKADGYWLDDAERLCRQHVNGLPAELDFSQSRAPGEGEINTVYTGWDGHMCLTRPDLPLAIEMSCLDTQGHFILFAPPGRDWLCFEPVTHVNNAHNLPGMPGLRWLAPGEAMSLTMRLRVLPA